MLGLANGPESERHFQISYKKDIETLVIEVIDHCQIQAKDIPRFVRFLIDLLKVWQRPISSNLRPSLGRGRDSDRGLRTLVGFVTGKITHCHHFDHALGVLPSACEAAVLDQLAQKGVHDIGSEELSTFLTALDTVNLDELRKLERSWTSINRRTWAGEQNTSCRNESVKAASAFVIVAFSSECLEKEFLVGVAFGEIREEDAIVYLLGHPNALVMRQGDNQSHAPRFVGQLVCLNRKLDQPSKDMVTQQSTPYFTIQSETDCVKSVRRIGLQVSTAEMLMISG